jgi:hypothetical protein
LTHEFVTELKQAGFSEPQAEAVTRLYRQAANATIEYVKHEHNLDNLVTNKDLDARIKGSRYFCERLFWASQPKQLAKT